MGSKQAKKQKIFEKRKRFSDKTPSQVKEVLISFVVPVYGASDYLEQCLNSILLGNENKPIEVIAINDGSPDNSAEILDCLNKQYANLTVIHQENMGGAGTINKGLALSVGKYISIVDNDDWLRNTAIDDYLRVIESENADVICTQITKKWRDREEIVFDTKYITERVVLKAHQKPAIMNDGMYLGKLFKNEFLKRCKILMDPSLLYADRPFTANALASAQSVLLFPQSMYNWRQREASDNLSITDDQFSFDNLADRIRSIRIMKFDLESRGYDYWLNTIDYFNCHRIFWCMKEIDLSDLSTPKKIRKSYEYLRDFAKVTKPYFSEVNLDKVTNLSPTQIFIVENIRENTHEIFAVKYLQRKFQYSTLNQYEFLQKKIETKLLESPKIVKEKSRQFIGKAFNQFSKNNLKNIALNEDHDSQLIVFESNFGKVYGQNPRYIYEELLRQNRVFRAVWVYQGKEKLKGIPGNVIQVHRGSKDYFHYLARAGYWVNNIRFTVTYKPEKTVYLQTWHGTPLKRLGLDIDVSGPEVEARESFLKESKSWDFLLAQNSYSAEIFKRAFSVTGKIITKGYPADDLLLSLNPEKSDSIKHKLGIKNKKVILYAPTWRDNERKGDSWSFTFSLALDLHKMKSQLSEEYVLLLRLHHLVADNIDLQGLEEFVIDVSNYPDTSELLLISDMLITDYSSIFFDYAVLKRPILFYMYDIEEYSSKLRGFYLDVNDDLPGTIIKSFEQLLDEIINVDFDVSKNPAFMSFHKRFCSEQEMNSAEQIVNTVFDRIPYMN